MRHCGPAKQRLWLGASRYLCRCPSALADANSYRNPVVDADTYTDAVQLVRGPEPAYSAYSADQGGWGFLPGWQFLHDGWPHGRCGRVGLPARASLLIAR